MGYLRKTATAALAAAVLTVGPAILPPRSTAASAQEITIKVWARADRSGPLRGFNIARAGDLLNKNFEAAGVSTRIKVEIFENNAKGFDDDALDLMKAFAVDKGPDIYVAAHEWIGAFAEAGLAMNLEEHIAKYPEYYSDIIDVLWGATKYKNDRYAIPQDSEIRMFFYNKEMLRKLGKSEEFIEGLPAAVDSGDFTIWDLSNLAKEVVDAGISKVGIVHRPNVGPDFLMSLASFGFDPFDEVTGKLQASKSALTEFLKWIDWNVKNGVTPANMTSYSWDTINAMLPKGETFIKHHGLWDVPRQIRIGGWENTEKAYFNKVGWLHSPAAVKGGTPANLSHPIVYVVSDKSANKELAAVLVAIATQSYFNTEHAVTTAHTAINYGQISQPAYAKAWAIREGAKMLNRATFMPNHPKIGAFNGAIYKGIQGVETGRLTPEEGATFITEEMVAEIGDQVLIIE